MELMDDQLEQKEERKGGVAGRGRRGAATEGRRGARVGHGV